MLKMWRRAGAVLISVHLSQPPLLDLDRLLKPGHLMKQEIKLGELLLETIPPLAGLINLSLGSIDAGDSSSALDIRCPGGASVLSAISSIRGKGGRNSIC